MLTSQECPRPSAYLAYRGRSRLCCARTESVSNSSYQQHQPCNDERPDENRLARDVVCARRPSVRR